MRSTSQSLSSIATTRLQAIERLVADVKLLPCNAQVAMKVLEVKRSPSAGAAEFAKLISADPALSAKVLEMANCAAFAPANPVTRLSVAISMIGLNNLLPLIFGLSFAGLFNKLSMMPADQKMLWRAALLKAVTAREWVMQLADPAALGGQREAVAEEAFLMGLLQDVSLPIFYAADKSAWPEYLAVLESLDSDRFAREERTFGIDHGSVSGACLRSLSLPSVFIKATAVHHGGYAALTEAGCGALTTALDLAASLPHHLTGPCSGRLLQSLTVRVQKRCSASSEQVASLMAGIADQFTRITTAFAEPDDQNSSFKLFLQNLGAEVAECLQSSIMKNATEITGLKDRERHLQEAINSLKNQAQLAELDTLTTTLRRATFLTRLGRLLVVARQHSAPCAIGFLDLDDFKQINDTHGHAGGDAALIAAAKSLTETLRDIGIVGRMGGDEFVFAVVVREGTLEAAMTLLASRLKTINVSYGGRQLKLTASIGIVPLGIPSATVNSEALLHEADQLMYESKRRGKGRATVGRLAPADKVAAA